MKISTKLRYATRAMLELALHQGEGPILIEGIAKNQELSKKYLETLLNTLKNNGLVKSIRGKGGGYLLNRPAQEITVKDIYVAIEGSHAVVDCVHDQEACIRSNICVTQELWREISRAFLEIMEEHTLQYLVESVKRKQSEATYMYYI